MFFVRSLTCSLEQRYHYQQLLQPNRSRLERDYFCGKWEDSFLRSVTPSATRTTAILLLALSSGHRFRPYRLPQIPRRYCSIFSSGTYCCWKLELLPNRAKGFSLPGFTLKDGSSQSPPKQGSRPLAAPPQETCGKPFAPAP